MLINWFTVAAQALNFLILVGLLKHFLYKPILTAIDAREKRIVGDLADAATKKAEAQKERDDFQHKKQELDQQRAGLLSKATDEAKAERERLIDEAQQAADAISANRAEALKREAQSLNQAISRRTQQEVFAVARKALTDLANTSLEERLGAVFTRRLKGMDAKAKAELAEAIKTSSEPALVRSAFELPAEQRAVLSNALNETFSADVQVRFETAPDLISGIELSAKGQKLAWSIADYLAALEKALGELVKKNDKPEPKPEAPKPEPKSEAPKPEAPKPEPKSEAPKPEPKPEAPKPEPKSEAPKPEAPQSEAPKPEPKSEAPKPEAPKPEPKPEAPKPEAPKPEANP